MPSRLKVLSAAALAGLLAGDGAYAYSTTQKVIGATSVLRGGGSRAAVDFDFQAGRYWQGRLRNSGEVLTVTRSSVGTNLLPTSASGYPYVTFAADTSRITPGLGLLVEEARTNLLLNSAVPATQTTSSLANATYTLWVNGSGSATMSAGTATGCGTGAATQGTPVNFTTTGAAGTCTVTVAGSLNAFQLEAGAFGTSLIVTAGATVTRAADVVTVTNVPAFSAAYTLFGKGTPQAPTTYVAQQGIIAANDGTANNRAQVYRAGTTGLASWADIVGGVSLAGTTGAAWSQVASGKLTTGFAAGVQAASFNGGAVFSGAGATVPAPSAIEIGNRSAGNSFWDGYVERIAIWPLTRLMSGDIQRITAP